jgi:hypothetical protein
MDEPGLSIIELITIARLGNSKNNCRWILRPRALESCLGGASARIRRALGRRAAS